MTNQNVLERARSAIGYSCKYLLGKGGFNPASQFPWNARGELDCCLVAETMVHSERGAVPIKDLVTGDAVWSWDGGTLNRRRVTATYAHGERDLLRLRTTGREVLLTGNHPLLTPVSLGRPRGASGTFGRRAWMLGWKPAGALRRGDWVVAASRIPLGTASKYDVEQCWVLGLYLADGSGSSICVYGETRDRVRAFFEARFGVRGTYTERGGFQTGSHVARRFFVAAGVTGDCYTKRVPEWVSREPEANVLSFLRGYLAGDGHESLRPYRSWSFASAARELLSGMRALCQAVGIRTSTVSRRERPDRIKIKGVVVKHARPLFTFEAYPDSARRGDTAACSARNAVSGDFALQRIRSIEPAGSAPVFDITVEGQHNFLADGIVVHNSGFAAWCLGISRFTETPFFLDREWIETTAIVQDAKRVGVGWFDEVPMGLARVGHLIVYGDAHGKQGHVGIVSKVDEHGPLFVIHCSRGNYTRVNDAIQETSAGFFKLRDAIVARAGFIEEPV